MCHSYLRGATKRHHPHLLTRIQEISSAYVDPKEVPEVPTKSTLKSERPNWFTFAQTTSVTKVWILPSLSTLFLSKRNFFRENSEISNFLNETQNAQREKKKNCFSKKFPRNMSQLVKLRKFSSTLTSVQLFNLFALSFGYRLPCIPSTDKRQTKFIFSHVSLLMPLPSHLIGQKDISNRNKIITLETFIIFSISSGHMSGQCVKPK